MNSSHPRKKNLGPWDVRPHHWAHFDEYAAHALLLQYGEMAGLKGIRKYRLTYVDAGSPVPSNLAKLNWKWERIIPLGVYGAWGPFDEHIGPRRGKKSSAASLALKYLKKRIPDFDDPRAEALVAYATRIDCGGGASRESMTNIVKSMNWLGDEERTHAWAIKGIMAYLDRGDPAENEFSIETIGALISQDNGQVSWIVAGYEALRWEKMAFDAAICEIKDRKDDDLIMKTVSGPNGSRRKIAAIKSSNPMIAKALLVFLRASVAIVKKPNGHVAILTTSNGYIELIGLDRILNREELRLRGDQRSETISFTHLGKEGSVSGSVWSFQASAKHQSLLNGSPSSPSVDPTKIPFERIVESAALALDEQRFAKEEDEGYTCDGTACSSSKEHPCPFWAHGLPRCQHLRTEDRNHNGNSGAQHQPTAKVIPIAPAHKAKQSEPSAPAPAHKPAPVANTALADKLAKFRSRLMY